MSKVASERYGSIVAKTRTGDELMAAHQVRHPITGEWITRAARGYEIFQTDGSTFVEGRSALHRGQPILLRHDGSMYAEMPNGDVVELAAPIDRTTDDEPTPADQLWNDVEHDERCCMVAPWRAPSDACPGIEEIYRMDAEDSSEDVR